MKKVLALIILTMPVVAQTLTLTGPTSVTAGSNATLELTLSGSSGFNLAGLQWTVTLPTGATISTVTPGEVAEGKQTYCTSAYTTCLSIGLSSTNVITNTAFVDGTIAGFPLVVPSTTAAGPLTVTLGSLDGVNMTGTSVAITGGAAYTINVVVPSPCSTTNASTVTVTDVVNVIDAITAGKACGLPNGICNLESAEAVLVAALGGACTLTN